MPRFEYTAKTAEGKQLSDVLEADDRAAAVRRLQAGGLFPLSVQERKEPWKFQFGGTVSKSALSVFTRRLADLLHGGLTLARALTVLERQTEQAALKKTAGELLERVQDGEHLSDALAHYPQIFPAYFSGAVKAGESGGFIDTVLGRLAEFLEKENDLRAKVQSAMAYPLIMLLTGVASVAFLLAVVIPKFEAMFADMGKSLPLPTKILVGISALIQGYWWAALLAAAAAGWCVNAWCAKPENRLHLDRALFRIPLFGDLIRKELVARFVRMLGALLHNGVPVLEALQLTRATIPNAALRAEIDVLVRSVREGGGIVEPLRASALFPLIVADMAAVGEETGNLDQALLRVCDSYEREVEYAVKTLTSVLEPVVILLVGVVVGSIAIAMMLPIFQVSSLMK